MFKVIVLLCSIGMSPNDCTKTTSIMNLESPSFTNSMECQTQAQPWLAKIAMKANPAKEYHKIICYRIKEVTNETQMEK